MQKKASSKGNARQSPNFVQRDIHHELLKGYARDPRRSKLCEGHLLFTAHSLEGSLVPSSASPPPSVSRVSSPLVSSSGSPLGLSDSPSGTSLFFISLVLFELMLLSGFLYRAQGKKQIVDESVTRALDGVEESDAPSSTATRRSRSAAALIGDFTIPVTFISAPYSDFCALSEEKAPGKRRRFALRIV